MLLRLPFSKNKKIEVTKKEIGRSREEKLLVSRIKGDHGSTGKRRFLQ